MGGRVKYEGVVVEQLPGGPKLVLFAAPAVDIAGWAGIPQRRRLGTGDEAVETAGFQREERPARVADIAAFMHNPANVIQNPLLAAVQDSDHIVIRETAGRCEIEVTPPDIGHLSLLELFNRATAELERRLPELAKRPSNPETLIRLRRTVLVEDLDNTTSELDDQDGDDESTAESMDEATPADDTAGAMALALFEEETQVVDFYDELKVRATILQELGTDGDALESVAGFSREFLESLIRPVVLVDGQHRLRGALLDIEDAVNSEAGLSRIAEIVDSGVDADSASEQFAREVGRRLPISLLLSADPAEHVFQFVVVNQKATPMSSALLGTIVSTSLTQGELDPIRLRLEHAGIELESSRAIAYLTRNADSPFRNLVATGVGGDRPHALQSQVLGKLTAIVRNLEGGSFFHTPTLDYAKHWRDGLFQASGLVDVSLTGSERLAAWSAIDGPWRTLFIKLHTKIRDKFGDPDDMKAQNAWGSTKSNLYNKISLTIMTADFFNYLQEKSQSLGDWEDVDKALEGWIGELSISYYARDWRMIDTKKDQSIIRKAWSEAWVEYRITKRLPRVERYNPGGRRG
jgi:hypothetical protein